MFRRPPRNFRGRQRAASSGSSGDERELASAPPLGCDRDEEAGSEESEEARGGTASSSEGARTAAEQPLPSGEPVRGTGAVLSFGSEEEEREGDEEFFKIKRPSFNEVTFRIQKKEILLSAEREADESKKVPQLEPGTDNTKGAQETKEENYSSLSEDYNSTDSENESNTSQRRKDSSAGQFPGHL
ncbi:hypothetical protein CIB84_012092 [Bambusicola thoracicus]|uniref:GCFC2 factor n=1 Tax=Bambusicola thoracicus TaxID=9083 RepID=A0A2P4SJ79_BAMTH|nr:hypothetical protein CIB84_012092 [Bambusicola thoracicus]